MNSKFLKIVQRLYRVLQTKLQSKASSKTSNPPHRKLYVVAYRFMGARITGVLPLFRDVNTNLQRAGLKANFKAYVSLTMLCTIIFSIATTISISCLSSLVFYVPYLPAVLFGVGGGLFTVAFSIIGFYVYPIYRADKLKRDLEDELPFTTGYMAVLASAGVSPEKIFYSISNLSVPLTISEEAENIVRHVNLFGADIISALQRTSKQTPSKSFREMIEGFITTVHSGANLATYLRGKSKEYMKLKRMNLDKFSDTLSVLSEFYVALLVTGPLLLVIMLAVMAMLGGGSFEMLSPDFLLSLLTYFGIPLGSVMFLIILDAVSPKW